MAQHAGADPDWFARPPRDRSRLTGKWIGPCRGQRLRHTNHARGRHSRHPMHRRSRDFGASQSRPPGPWLRALAARPHDAYGHASGRAGDTWMDGGMSGKGLGNPRRIARRLPSGAAALVLWFSRLLPFLAASFRPKRSGEPKSARRSPGCPLSQANRQMHLFRSVGVVGTACRKGGSGNWGRPVLGGGQRPQRHRQVPVPAGVGQGRTYCRGWVTPAEGRTLTSGTLSKEPRIGDW